MKKDHFAHTQQRRQRQRQRRRQQQRQQQQQQPPQQQQQRRRRQQHDKIVQLNLDFFLQRNDSFLTSSEMLINGNYR